MGNLSTFSYLFIYSIIYLCQYGFTSIYFTLGHIMQSYVIYCLLKSFQLWLLGVLSVVLFLKKSGEKIVYQK